MGVRADAAVANTRVVSTSLNIVRGPAGLSELDGVIESCSILMMNSSIISSSQSYSSLSSPQ